MKIMKINILFLMILYISFCLTLQSEYCNLSSEHTMCVYTEVGSDCLPLKIGGINNEERKLIVNAHNNIRRKVALGLQMIQLRSVLFPAANMVKLSWDKETEDVAQRWADQCKNEKDKFRDLRRFTLAQNIFVSYKEHEIDSWKEAITYWFDDIQYLSYHLIDSYVPSKRTENAVNILWHSMFAVGCGKRSFQMYTIYVCNYGPNKVKERKSVYKAGEPCSKCPAKHYCQNGLCVDTNTSYISREYENLPKKFSSLFNSAT